MDALAYPLPLIVIAQLFGVPSTDRALFKDCTDPPLGLRVDPALTSQGMGQIVAEATKDLDAYLLAEVRRRRAHPSGDMLSDLVDAKLDGQLLSDAEIAGLAATLLTAGYVTTTLLLGSALLCLRDNPGAGQDLRADRSLVPKAIEEVLRCRPLVPQAYRIANEDVLVAGEVVPADAFVKFSVLSANHDRRRLSGPDRYDPHRSTNKHLAFGHGIGDDITFHDAKRMMGSARR